MSQCSRVLEVLRDGKPHSIQEIHERAGTMRLNSRISDLRNMGFNILYYRKDGLHTYQLLWGWGVRTETSDGSAAADSSLLGPPTTPGSSAVVHAPEAGHLPRAGSAASPCPTQPTLWSGA